MRRMVIMFTVAAATTFPLPAASQPQIGSQVSTFNPVATGSVSITEIRTGWNADSFAVVTAETIMNPARCTNPDGYISDKSLPGYETYYAAALTAIAARRRAVVTVDNLQCFAGRPKIVGITVTSQ